MNINVPKWARAHFWDEPPEGDTEFWAFRFKPPCQPGDELVFRFDGVSVARAVCSVIQPPSVSACDSTGRFGDRWKVFWTPASFEDVPDTP